MFSEVITNAANWSTNGFTVTDAAMTPINAATYFWAGFTLSFTAGLVQLGFTWVRRIVGGGTSES